MAGGVDYVLEITGNAQLMQLAIEVLKKRGIAAFFTGDGVPDFVPRGKRPWQWSRVIRCRNYLFRNWLNYTSRVNFLLIVF